MESKRVLRYECVVKGLFGRNRTVKFQTFKIAEGTLEDPISDAALMPLFRAKLAEIKFKGGIARIIGIPITVEERTIDGHTYTSELSEWGSSRTIHEERIDGPGMTFKSAVV